jgi:hypothetical protein
MPFRQLEGPHTEMQTIEPLNSESFVWPRVAMVVTMKGILKGAMVKLCTEMNRLGTRSDDK